LDRVNPQRGIGAPAGPAGRRPDSVETALLRGIGFGGTTNEGGDGGDRFHHCQREAKVVEDNRLPFGGAVRKAQSFALRIW